MKEVKWKTQSNFAFTRWEGGWDGGEVDEIGSKAIGVEGVEGVREGGSEGRLTDLVLQHILDEAWHPRLEAHVNGVVHTRPVLPVGVRMGNHVPVAHRVIQITLEGRGEGEREEGEDGWIDET